MIGVSDVPALARVPARHAKRPSRAVRDPVGRLQANAGACAWVDDHYDPRWFKWETEYLGLPYAAFAETFSHEELARLWHASVVMSPLTDHFEKNEPFLWRVQNSLWQFGCMRDYNKLVDALDGLRRLRFPIDGEDFSIAIAYTVGCSVQGWVGLKTACSVYLDGPMGIIVRYKGEHVLTIGFALAREGCLISQVQLRKKKGNRFLYRLKGHVLDVAVEMMAAAFGQVWLVQGSSAVHAVRQSYVPASACKMTDDDAARIVALYDRPLAGFDRARGPTYPRQGRFYTRLVPKEAAPVALTG